MAYDDLSDHPFAVHMATEAAGLEETDWERWAAKAKKIAGHSLDGSQDEDGYSLDSAHDAYEAGDTPEEYVASIVRPGTAAPRV